MSRTPLLVLGSHIFAEEVADLVAQSGEHEVVGFVENWERERCAQRLHGLPVHWVGDVGDLAVDHDVLCAIGSTKRRAFVEQVAAMGFRFARVRHPSAVVAPSATIGAGTLVGAGVVVGAHTTIGEHVILNRGALVGHHTTIGSFVTVSPGANVAGCVTIGDEAYVAMGAIVLDRMTIGEQAVVGAGAVVTKPVDARTQVLGVPAKPVKAVEGR
jgi:sugar O-acyltransferase (sialic acid O-acetyltransferase NeuD family)